MSSDEAGFQNAILRERTRTRAGSSRRLADEHGQPTGPSSIRLQTTASGLDVPNRIELEARERELRATELSGSPLAGRARPAGPAEFIRSRLNSPLGTPPPTDLSWRHANELHAPPSRVEGELRVRGSIVVSERGFVTRVSATAEAFILSGGLWCQRHPLRQVSLVDVAGRADRLAAAPHLSAVRQLTIKDTELHDDDLVALAEAPRPGGTDRFANLEGLCIEAEGFVGSRGLAALARCSLPRLRGTCLHGTRIDDRGAAAMAAASGCPNLKIFNLMGSRVGNDGLAALLMSPRRESLVWLALAHSRVSGGGLNALADLPDGSALKELNLYGNPIKRASVQNVGAALRKHPRLGLNLWECPIPQATRELLALQFGERVFPGLYAMKDREEKPAR